MTERTMVDFVETWQSGAAMVLLCAFIGFAVGTAASALRGPGPYGIVGIVLDAVGGPAVLGIAGVFFGAFGTFLALSYLRYGR